MKKSLSLSTLSDKKIGAKVNNEGREILPNKFEYTNASFEQKWQN